MMTARNGDGARSRADKNERPEHKAARSPASEYLLDKDRSSCILLKRADGVGIMFAQVFCTERDGSTYCILLPIERIEGVSDGQAILFELIDGKLLRAVRDAHISKEIFDEYYACIRRMRGESNE